MVDLVGNGKLVVATLATKEPTESWKEYERLFRGLGARHIYHFHVTGTMLIGGASEKSHRIDENLRLAAGFGFAKDMVVDQHFAERGRINRLLAVIGQNPRIIGVGIDEDTAIELKPSRRFGVIGSGGVTVLDGRDVSYSNLAERQAESTMSLFGTRLHLLSQGDTFELKRRTLRQRRRIGQRTTADTKSSARWHCRDALPPRSPGT